MIKFIKSFFGSKKEELPPQTYEQHKATVVLTPVPAGTPLVNDAGEVVAIADGNPAPGPKVEKAKKKPAAKKATGEKKPRAPRKPKAV